MDILHFSLSLISYLLSRSSASTRGFDPSSSSFLSHLRSPGFFCLSASLLYLPFVHDHQCLPLPLFLLSALPSDGQRKRSVQKSVFVTESPNIRSWYAACWRERQPKKEWFQMEKRVFLWPLLLLFSFFFLCLCYCCSFSCLCFCVSVRACFLPSSS